MTFRLWRCLVNQSVLSPKKVACFAHPKVRYAFSISIEYLHLCYSRFADQTISATIFIEHISITYLWKYLSNTYLSNTKYQKYLSNINLADLQTTQLLLQISIEYLSNSCIHLSKAYLLTTQLKMGQKMQLGCWVQCW